MPGSLFRVDTKDPVPGRYQRLDPRTTVGLDAHQHIRGAGVRASEHPHKLTKSGDPSDALRQPSPAKNSPQFILDLHVVMILSPIVTDEQQHSSLPP